MASSSESPVKARFFKVMMPGFHTKLLLPPAFCMKLKAEIPEQVHLTSCKGTWRVEIGQYGNGSIYFEKGWDNFAKNHDLKIGEFVVFEQIDSTHFKASIFDSTTCGKQFPVEVHEDEDDLGVNIDDYAQKPKRGRGRPRKRAASLHEEEAPFGRGRLSNAAASAHPKRSFVRTIMAYNIDGMSPVMYIPGTIWRPYHMSEKTRTSLRGPSREWHEVNLIPHSRGRLCMKNGWREFCSSNKIRKGDVCFFQITQASSKIMMMDVKVSRHRS